MIRPKKRVRKVSWRTGKVREDAAGIRKLRLTKYRNANGKCEVIWNGKRCNKFAAWDGPGKGDLIHLDVPGIGRTDTVEGTEWGCHDCHMRRDHPGPQWSPLIRRGGDTPVPDSEGLPPGPHADV